MSILKPLFTSKKRSAGAHSGDLEPCFVAKPQISLNDQLWRFPFILGAVIGAGMPVRHGYDAQRPPRRVDEATLQLLAAAG